MEFNSRKAFPLHAQFKPHSPIIEINVVENNIKITTTILCKLLPPSINGLYWNYKLQQTWGFKIPPNFLTFYIQEFITNKWCLIYERFVWWFRSEGFLLDYLYCFEGLSINFLQNFFVIIGGRIYGCEIDGIHL